MRKILAVFVLVSALCSIALSQEFKVSDVNFEGLKNVKAKTVKSQIKTRAGKNYSEDTIKSDIQTILGLGYFDNVEVNVDTAVCRVTFQLKEKPYIKKIVFKGNKKFSSGKLSDEIPLKEKEYYDLAKLEESKSKIMTLYKDKGYADVKLDVYPTIDETTSQMTVSFLVTEGNRILIGDVFVEGAKAYSAKKIRKLMKTKKKKVFKQETLQEDLKEIEKLYKNSGYMNVKIDEPTVTYNDNRTLMFIRINIAEGIRYKTGNITFSGNSTFTDTDLRRTVSLQSGQIYNEEKLIETRQAILETYSDKGYLHAQVEPRFNENQETGVMDIAFDIIENNIVYLGNIYIDGLSYTKEYVIRREVALKEGDVFSAGKVRRSIEKIYNLGFIDYVEPQIQPTDQPDTMDLVLGITEGKPGILSAGAGYSSVDQLVGTLQVQHINLFGRGQRLNLLWEFGARKQNYEIDWTEPWFMGKPMTFGTSIFDTSRAYDYGTVYSAYTESRKGGSVKLGPRLSDTLSLLFTYSYEQIEIFDIDESIKSEIQSSVDVSNGITSSLSSQIVWDTRDSVFDATHGNRQSFSLQYAGGPLGGNVNFVKPIVRSSWFIPTFWKFVLSLNGTVGSVESFPPSGDVPIYERFYVGGAETIRGYQYRSEIGPTQGGKFMSVFNAEYKFPIVQEKNRTILQGAFFYDIGGSWLSPNDAVWHAGEGTNELKQGIGFGIRFTTPVFPLRLDWGYGLNHRPGEQLSQFYFTIGNIF
jgi:outer membrane protein insertion porin family